MTPADRTTMQQLGVSMWRLLVALTRLATAQKALRLAASGALVICDRWPQSIAPGMLDGPALEPPPSMRLARLISRVEQWLYQRMDGLRPTLTIHLTCPYETSATRKPGAIEREDFDRRVVLMEELRRRDPSIQVVDVRQDMEKVTSDLLGHVWARLVAPGPIKLAPASQADLLLPTVTPQTVALGEPAVVV
jgi:thymidylate kinase